VPAGSKWNGGDSLFVAACVISVVSLFAAYSNHFDNGFHFDDAHVIVNNLSIRGLHDPARFFTDAQTFTSRPQNAVYRPLLTLSYALDYKLGGGLESRQFHVTQFALLLLLGSLLVVFFRKLFASGEATPWDRWGALAAATLFCVHTANTETVNYLSARSSLVATLGVVASFVIYLCWPHGRRTYLYLLPMLIGGLAKPLTVMFAPLLFVFVLFFEQRCSLKELFGPYGPRALSEAVFRSLPASGAAGALYVFLRGMEPSTLEYAVIDRWTYAMTQPFVWLHYFRLFLFPSGLTADTDWTWLDSWLDPRLAAGLLFIGALIAAVAWLSRKPRLRPVAFGLAWFAITLIPTSSIIPLSEVYNEHRIFLPYVGLVAAAAWAVCLGLTRIRRPAPAVVLGALLAIGVVTAHGIGTYRRNVVWLTEETLWKDVTIKSPRNGRGLMNYGLTLMSDGHLSEALDHFERAAEITPNYSILEINLGIVKSALGQTEQSEPHFLRALALTPDYARGHFYYAKWLVEHARAPEAVAHLERAVEGSPGDVDANRMLMDLHAAVGEFDALSEVAQNVLDIAPSDLAALAYSEGRVPFEVDEESAEAYAALGLQKINTKSWLESAVLYQQALQLDPQDSTYWNNLGWALANAGFLDLAAPCLERALGLDPESEYAGSNLNWVRELQSEPGRSPAASP